MLLWILNMDYPPPEEKSLIYQSNDLVIIYVDNMGADNNFTTIKFEKKSGALLYPNYWMAGVYYEDKNMNEKGRYKPL